MRSVAPDATPRWERPVLGSPNLRAASLHPRGSRLVLLALLVQAAGSVSSVLWTR